MPALPPLRTAIPARLDRLRWGRFHTLLIAALGTSWIIDGLEVTLVGALASVLTLPSALGLTPAQIGVAAGCYVAGAVAGAIVFGGLADRYGRRRLFFITLGIYAVATVACGFASDFVTFAALRALTGAGIGGEYAAINSAIQEFMPARLRGRVDLAVNGSFWVGAAIGAAGAALVLDSGLIPESWGWRLAFVVGGALALAILPLRRFIPESPRWLLLQRRDREAEQIVAAIEARSVSVASDDPPAIIVLDPRGHVGWFELFGVLLRRYPRRVVLGVSLMLSQAFLYNAIFFTYALVLTRYYGVAEARVGLYLLPFAAGNFLGPLVLGPLFDHLGRRFMITATYGLTGVLIIATGALFAAGALDAITQTVAWSVVFFFASAAASSAYLTVGENFPLEVRAATIAWFYAVGTGLGGIVGPIVFGQLIATGGRADVFAGYALGGCLMLAAAAVARVLAVDAERRSLESVAAPLALLESDPCYGASHPSSESSRRS
ncbi:MAG TPA: MFS transporter [Casimicrobiaceae bacterium]|nr:MFS transporter [Casimicrobiaceae bacterium]